MINDRSARLFNCYYALKQFARIRFCSMKLRLSNLFESYKKPLANVGKKNKQNNSTAYYEMAKSKLD